MTIEKKKEKQKKRIMIDPEIKTKLKDIWKKTIMNISLFACWLIMP